MSWRDFVEATLRMIGYEDGERLGHSSFAVTLDLYSHVISAMQEDAASRIAALVSGS